MNNHQLNRNYFFYWTSQWFNDASDFLRNAGLIFFAYDFLHPPALMVGWIIAAQTAPTLIFGPFLGVLVDRISPKKMMITMLILKTLLIGCLFFSIHGERVAFLFGIITAISIVQGFFRPAEKKMMHLIVPPPQFVRANGYYQLEQAVWTIAGFALGTLAYNIGGMGLIIWVNVFLGLMAMLMLLLVKTGQREEIGPTTYRQDWLNGFFYVWKKSELRLLWGLNFNVGLGLGVIQTLFVFYVTSALHMSKWWVSVFTAAQGSAAVLITFWVLRSTKKPAAMRSLSISLALLTCGVIVLALSPNYLLALMATAMTGIGLALFDIAVGSLQLQIINASYRGRVEAFFQPGMRLAMLLSSILGGALKNILDIRWIFIGAGLILLCSVLLAVRKNKPLA